MGKRKKAEGRRNEECRKNSRKPRGLEMKRRVNARRLSEEEMEEGERGAKKGKVEMESIVKTSQEQRAGRL